ncbi:MAG: type II secretion system protein GspM [Sphingobium sp.]
MIGRLRTIWIGRSRREQLLLGIMGALLAIVLLWVGVVMPLQAARTSARDALKVATERNVAIRAKVKLMKTLPRGSSSGPAGSLDQLVGQSAGEAGLSLDRAQAQGKDRIDIAIASVRPIALFTWLSALEGQGVRIETMSARPSPTAESVSVQAVLAREETP